MGDFRKPVGSAERPAKLAPVYAQTPQLEPWLQAMLSTPFAQDTLRRLNPDYQVRQEPGHGNTIAYTPAGAPESIVVRQKGLFNEETLAHEVAHTAEFVPMRDYKRLMPRIKAIMDLGVGKKANSEQRAEFFAEAVASRLVSLRGSAPFRYNDAVKTAVDDYFAQTIFKAKK